MILGGAGKSRPEPILVAPKDGAGWVAYAQPEATERMFNGIDQHLAIAIRTALPEEQWELVKSLIEAGHRTPVVPAMPFVDAIDLARFMVNTTSGYSHHLLGPDTVGGPVEIAGITRHEGFKWISRKHYYSPDLNPEEPSYAY